MQTKSIILASTISTAVSAAAIAANNPGMPTLGGPNWYDWNSASVPTAASTPVPVASASWSAYTSVAAVSASSWSQWPAWTPSASTTQQAYITTSSYKYENPFTVYLSMTDSRGVVTGMPSVVTSQPAVVTSQPAVATPITSKAAQVNSSMTTSTASGSASFQQTRTASASIAVMTGGAALNRVGGCAAALVVMGLGFSLL